MTALSAAFNRDHKETGSIKSFPVYESVTIYKGALVMAIRETGYAIPGADTASGIFLGVALENADNSSGSSGDINVQVKSDGVWAFTLASVAQGDVGKKCYISDDNTVCLTGQSNDVCVGTVVGVKTTNTAWVELAGSTGAGAVVATAPAAVTSHELTDNSGGSDPGDQTLAAVTLPATITDSSTGADPGDDTIAAITEAATITDNSGGVDSGDDTLAAVTNLNELTDSGGGTADQTVEDVADIALSTGDTYTDAAVNGAVNTAIASISNNFKEMTTELALQRAANTTLLAHIAQLAAKMNTNSTAIDSASDAVAQLAAKMNVVTAALTQMLEHTALFAAEYNLAQDDIVALRGTLATIEGEVD